MVLLKLVAVDNSLHALSRWADEVGLGQDALAESLRRAEDGELYNSVYESVNRRALYNFLLHGLPHVFPAALGERKVGIPTAHAIGKLKRLLHADELYVWPDDSGDVDGIAVEPLDALVLATVKSDIRFHELAALVDALRVGRARDRQLARKELEELIISA